MNVALYPVNSDRDGRIFSELFGIDPISIRESSTVLSLDVLLTCHSPRMFR